MGIDTHIEWCDSTHNLMMGCSGCELWNKGTRTCYAGIMTRQYEGKTGWPIKFETPAIFPQRQKEALRWADLTGKPRPKKPWLDGYPRLIFLDDMGDTFTEGLEVDWLMPYVEDMIKSPHIWMFLTKRAKRMKQFFDLLGHVPPNFWPGVTITSRGTFSRVEVLRKIGGPNTIRWMSVEPVLESFAPMDFTGISAALIGGESGPKARPMKFEWVMEIYEACRASGTAFFLKQWGRDENNPDVSDPTRKSAGGMSKGGARFLGREWREMPDWKKAYPPAEQSDGVQTPMEF